MLSDDDWASIYAAIAKSQSQSEVVYGKVVKRNERRKLVWIEEFGDQPIPMVGFRGEVKIYDEYPLGGAGAYGGKDTKVKIVKVKPVVPAIGETVVVLRQFGSRHLPKAVGVILSTGFVVD